MYVQVGDLALVGDHSTVPLTRISCNKVFSKSQNVRKAGTLCIRQNHFPHIATNINPKKGISTEVGSNTESTSDLIWIQLHKYFNLTLAFM